VGIAPDGASIAGYGARGEDRVYVRAMACVLVYVDGAVALGGDCWDHLWWRSHLRAGKKDAERSTEAGARTRSARRRHEEHCRICQHPQRAEIEQEFLSWESPRAIAAAHGVSKTAVYRHVEAVGLGRERRMNQLDALDRVIERVSDVRVTAGDVIAAIRLSAELEGKLDR
jgi:hypothetical protein